MISNPPAERKKHTGKKQIFVGQGNNEDLIKSNFQDDTKWVIQSTKAVNPPPFFFKWVQCVKDIDYSRLIEGCQMVNHIQNIKIIASKTGLHQTLMEFQKEEKSKNLPIQLTDFYPLTYLLNLESNDLSQEEQAFQKADEGSIWIYKPAAMNCGKGITLITDLRRFKEDYFRKKKHTKMLTQAKPIPSVKNIRRREGKPKTSFLPIISSKFVMKTQEKKSTSTDIHRRRDVEKKEEVVIREKDNEKSYTLLRKGVLQQYLQNPLLLEGKKFDYRCYCFVACTKPLLVLFHNGYLRLSMNKYSMSKIEDESNRFTHLTNASVQKKHPDFLKEKENTIWSLEKFEKYMMNNHKVSKERFEEVYHQIKQIFAFVFTACEKKLMRRYGTFELLGCDILFDEGLNPHLLELNANPAIFTDTKTQTEVIPDVVKNAINIALRLNEKASAAGEIMKKLDNFELFGFEVLYNEALNYIYQ